MSIAEGVDYAFTRIDEVKLAKAGKTFAMRYVGPGSDAKHLTAQERDRIWAAGLSIVLLAEAGAQSALGGHDAGAQHARQAQTAATRLGAPNLPIYFAVDFDVTATQWPVVAAYLRGAAMVIGPARVGVYGGLRAVQWASRDKVAVWFFQTYAWSRGVWFPGNHVEQYHNGVQLAGGTVDLCRATKPDFGQWSRAAAPEGDDMTPDQEAKLTDLLNIVTGLAHGVDKVAVHDRDGQLSLAGLYQRIGQTQVLEQVQAQSAALTAIAAALSSSGGNPDTAPVLAAISGLHDQLAALAAENNDLREKLAAALDPTP